MAESAYYRGVINVAWRTDTVRSICEAMRVAQDFSAAPILADALEEAGCNVPTLLARLRGADSAKDQIEIQRLVALVYSEESAVAVRFIEELDHELDDEGDERHVTTT